MFENAFNLSFNLHKAYTDIGICDEDREKMSCIYNIPLPELENVLQGFATQNRENAQMVLKERGAVSVNHDRQFRIAYMGDSITSYRMSHRCITQEILRPYTNIVWGDFSISGWKVTDLFTAFYPSIDTFDPNIAVMMIGTNDMRITDDEYGYVHTPQAHFKRDLQCLLQTLEARGCHVILTTLPPFSMEKMNAALPGWKILYKEEVRREYDAMIARTAREQNAILVDMREVYAAYHPADLTIEDGLHLNPRGQRLLASCIFAEMKKLLEQE